MIETKTVGLILLLLILSTFRDWMTAGSYCTKKQTKKKCLPMRHIFVDMVLNFRSDFFIFLQNIYVRSLLIRRDK